MTTGIIGHSYVERKLHIHSAMLHEGNRGIQYISGLLKMTEARWFPDHTKSNCPTKSIFSDIVVCGFLSNLPTHTAHKTTRNMECKISRTT